MVDAFLKKLLPKKSKGIGLELTPDRLNIVQLSHNGPTYKLETFVSAEIPEGVITEGLISDPPEMAQIIQATLAEHKLKPKGVATGIPSKEGVIRIIPVPAELSDKELRDMVNQEAGLYLPFPREEADVDYQKLGTFPDEDGIEKVQVLLVATRKEVTDTYISTFREAGLKIDVLEITSFALLRTIRDMVLQVPPEEALVLADIEFDSTEIAIMVDGIPQFSRTIPIGTYQIQTAVNQALNLPPTRDTTMLQDMVVPANPTEITGSGKMGESQPEIQAMTKVLTELGEELRRSIDFFVNQSEGLDASQLLLAGPGAVIGQIDEFFNQRLAMTTLIVDPVQSTSVQVDEEKITQAMRPSIGVVLGLGMREV
ncbi:MAG: type IV pilus assembly protein PilM [Oscillatoriaceae cyanobacterium]